MRSSATRGSSASAPAWITTRSPGEASGGKRAARRPISARIAAPIPRPWRPSATEPTVQAFAIQSRLTIAAPRRASDSSFIISTIASASCGRGGRSAKPGLETGQRGARKVPGRPGELLAKPLSTSERAVDKSAATGRKGRSMAES